MAEESPLKGKVVLVVDDEPDWVILFGDQERVVTKEFLARKAQRTLRGQPLKSCFDEKLMYYRRRLQ